MIKANEIRLGNYVVSIENNIYQIDEHDFEYTHNGCISDINPIPLTEEWLTKFGFVFGIELQDFVKGKHQFIELNCLCGYFSENDIFYYAEKTKLKYVHQLQNLYFAITGEELTIKN